MAEYRIYSRGAGLAEAIANGSYCETYFTSLFEHCPERILRGDKFRRLEHFLFAVPRLHAKRTKSQRAEAAELLGLISAATAGAIAEEARDLPCRRIAGRRIRAAHRPTGSKYVSDRREGAIVLAKWIKQCVEEWLRWSQETFAEEAGIHRTYVSDIERGARSDNHRRGEAGAAAWSVYGIVARLV